MAKGAGGRPTKYSKEVLKQARDYLDNFADFDQVIPSEAGLAMRLNLSRSTVQDWGKQEEKKEFSCILRAIQAKQEVILINKGLTGDFNSAIAKLALGKHGYSEKSETDVTTGGKPLKNVWHIHPTSSKPDAED